MYLETPFHEHKFELVKCQFLIGNVSRRASFTSRRTALISVNSS